MLRCLISFPFSFNFNLMEESEGKEANFLNIIFFFSNFILFLNFT